MGNLRESKQKTGNGRKRAMHLWKPGNAVLSVLSAGSFGYLEGGRKPNSDRMRFLMATTQTFTRGSISSSWIGRVFSSIGGAIVSSMEKKSRQQIVQILQAKSDAELAQMGLKRDDIIRHVFSDMFYC
ncbi:hypothetical protein ACFFUT_16655 [Pseudohalocynthiibacter aestuariivivens]|jgi:hypothetical protein|uniref:DUF1127 domain-containing protein n=1 Tax=Pseudohalocynthiibacter aestuariivivens TaxID=1591409 RepID=A0ABV5JIZ9_9RHOB|nr:MULTISPECIES: hypothetical protein [Pseudohalocynthiibacter]MCK0101736.1 hypothetical protein [Pseudohalocynthiibacter sp. F2068]